MVRDITYTWASLFTDKAFRPDFIMKVYVVPHNWRRHNTTCLVWDHFFKGSCHILNGILSGIHDSLLGLFYADPPPFRKIPGIQFFCTVTCLSPPEIHPCLINSINTALVDIPGNFHSHLLCDRSGDANCFLLWIFGTMKGLKNYIIHLVI